MIVASLFNLWTYILHGELRVCSSYPALPDRQDDVNVYDLRTTGQLTLYQTLNFVEAGARDESSGQRRTFQRSAGHEGTQSDTAVPVSHLSTSDCIDSIGLQRQYWWSLLIADSRLSQHIGQTDNVENVGRQTPDVRCYSATIKTIDIDKTRKPCYRMEDHAMRCRCKLRYLSKFKAASRGFHCECDRLLILASLEFKHCTLVAKAT